MVMGELQLKRSVGKNGESIPKSYIRVLSRAFCEEDKRQIRKGYRQLFKAIRGDKFFHPFPFIKETIDKILYARDDLYFLVYEQKKVVGFFMLRGWDEGFDIPSFGMVVHPKYRGLGIGTKMLNSAIDACIKRGVKKIRLTIDKENIVARNIYKKAGFKFKGNIGFKTLWRKSHLSYLKQTGV